MKQKVQKRKDVKTSEKKAPTTQVEEVKELENLDAHDEDDVEPVERLELSDEELKKDVTLILHAENPYFSEEFVEFSFKDLTYKTLSDFPHTATIFSQSGALIHKDLLHLQEETDNETKAERDVNTTDELDSKRKNKFNFCDRAVQTLNHEMRDEILQAEPPLQTKIGANATLMEMTEAFQNGKIDKARPGNKKKNELSEVTYTAKVLDRMVNQNKFFDITLDFGFYDNPCDEFLEHGLGSMLPLWKFCVKETKGMAATTISWNHQYVDMFAVGYGTREFLQETNGFICIYTLKCPLYPERIFHCNAGVQSVAFHHQWRHLLAAGFSDGVVAVFDLRRKEDKPRAISEQSEIQHTDLISTVRWLDDNIDHQHNFCSLSGDGKILNWCLTKSEIIPSEVISLKNKDCKVDGPEGAQMNAINCGVSMSFNNNSLNLFLVSTEDGLIHKCSNLYCNQYLSTYTSHSNTVYCVEWNPYHPRVFLSSSGDWTVLIWDHQMQRHCFLFDMFSEIKAATWAPFSSTLFACITEDGKVHVFDLAMNRQGPTCSYVYGQKNAPIDVKLTSLAFNPKLPIILVGDNKGGVMSFKLSPNVRSSIKGMTEVEWSKFVAGEIDKMDKVLRLAPGDKK